MRCSPPGGSSRPSGAGTPRRARAAPTTRSWRRDRSTGLRRRRSSTGCARPLPQSARAGTTNINTNVLSNVTKPLELVGCPRTGCSLHGVPDVVERLEPAVGRRLIAHTPPDALLHVERGLVGGQIVQMQPRVSAQELPDRFALVPTGAVDIEGDAVVLETPIEMAEDFEEALAVALLGADHAAATEQGRDPAREVEPRVVLAGGGHPQALAAPGPAEAEPRMQGEAGLVLKHHGFVGAKAAEFFLEPAGIGGHPQSGPGGRQGWRASSGSPAGASSSAPAELSARHRSGASDGPPWSARPSEPDSTRTPAASAQGAPRARVGPWLSVSPGVPAWVVAPGSGRLVH